jgi:hypothetical protein
LTVGDDGVSDLDLAKLAPQSSAMLRRGCGYHDMGNLLKALRLATTNTKFVVLPKVA